MQRPKQLVQTAWLVLLLAGAIAFGACMSHAEQRESFIIAWNYDTSGYLETCGCSSHQLGGLPRRATLLAQLREKQPVLAIEGAHLLAEKGDFQLFKAEMITAMLGQMDYSGLMLGVREAQHGVEGIAKIKESAKFPLFSANLTHNGQPAAEQSFTKEVGGNRVFVTGVSQPAAVNFELPEGMAFAEPWQALDAELAKAKKEDLKVVCLEGETSWIEETMHRYQGQADLFLTGDRSIGGKELDFNPDPPQMNNYNEGRYTAIVNVDPAQSGYLVAGRNVPLQDTLDDHSDIRTTIDEHYKTQLKDRFFGTMKEQLEKLYLPPSYCKDCHEEAYNVYALSGHSRALAILESKGQLYNPDCMKCHVSYDSGEDKLVTMDCTTCHTNITDDHVWQANMDPKSIKAPNPPVTTYTYAWCHRCHDEANSVRFKEHWPQMVHRIAHGGDLGPARQAAQELGIDMTADPPAH